MEYFIAIFDDRPPFNLQLNLNHIKNALYSMLIYLYTISIISLKKVDNE